MVILEVMYHQGSKPEKIQLTELEKKFVCKVEINWW